MTTLLMIGTRKGLFLARSDDRATWSVDGPHFAMNAVYAATIDARPAASGGSVRLLAGADSEHWGPSVFRSDDLGASWQETEGGAIRFPAETGAALVRTWQLVPAGADQPGVVWAGVEPGALFRSDDGGESFSLVEGLWEHPHRERWMPGGGGLCLHTVVPHATDPDRMLVGVSAAGVYRSDDGGKSWEASNTGIDAWRMPDQRPEFGQCVEPRADGLPKEHAYVSVRRDALCTDDPDPAGVYFGTRSGEVFASANEGASWTSIVRHLPDVLVVRAAELP